MHLSKSRTLPGTLDALSALPGVIDECAAFAQLTERQAKGLRLAVDELVTNSITHGYEESGRSGLITLDWDLDASGRLVFGIEDRGVPYDPTTADDPDHVNLPLEERPIGGLGIMLVRRNVDEMRYRFDDGTNRVELVLTPDVSDRI